MDRQFVSVIMYLQSLRIRIKTFGVCYAYRHCHKRPGVHHPFKPDSTLPNGPCSLLCHGDGQSNELFDRLTWNQLTCSSCWNCLVNDILFYEIFIFQSPLL